VSAAREHILKRIRDANTSQPASRESEYQGLAREYRKAGQSTLKARLDLFVERLRDYGAVVYRCAEASLNETIARATLQRGKSALLIPLDIPNAWLTNGVHFHPDRNLTYGEIDASEGVLTGCALSRRPGPSSFVMPRVRAGARSRLFPITTCALFLEDR
jgi:L-lactate dehydrogenase complex protein LldG